MTVLVTECTIIACKCRRHLLRYLLLFLFVIAVLVTNYSILYSQLPGHKLSVIYNFLVTNCQLFITFWSQTVSYLRCFGHKLPAIYNFLVKNETIPGKLVPLKNESKTKYKIVERSGGAPVLLTGISSVYFGIWLSFSDIMCLA